MHYIVKRSGSINITSNTPENHSSFKVDYNNVNEMDSNNPNNNGNIIGSASDYVLIGMIVAMMFCMTVCCLCLFCRSASRFTICGFNFEMNNPSTPVAPEDLSELHEVVPLTPTTAGTCQLPDIENMLRSDPPPPRYSDVASSSMRDRFKWRSKRRTTLSNEQKLSKEVGKQKSGGTKNRSRVPFQRSVSYQTTRSPSIPTNTSLPSHISISSEDQKQPKRGGIFASFRIRSSRMAQSASESSISKPVSHRLCRNISESNKLSEIPADSQVKFELNDSNDKAEAKCLEKKSSQSKNQEVSNDDDDEVFM